VNVYVVPSVILPKSSTTSYPFISVKSTVRAELLEGDVCSTRNCMVASGAASMSL